MRGFVLATHFGPTLLVSAITTILSLEIGLGPKSLLIFLVAITGQCSIGWSNDAADAERDEFAQRTTKPVVGGLINQKTLWRFARGAALLSAALSFFLGWEPALLYIVALASAWSYNLGLKSTVLSPLPYAISFGSLPGVITLSADPPHWPPIAGILGAAMLGMGAHFINTLKDTASDHTAGVRGLPQRIGPQASLWIGDGTAAAAFTLLMTLGTPTPWTTALWVLGLINLFVIVGCGLTRNMDWAWRFTLIEAFLCVAVLVSSGSSLGH